MKLNRFMKKAFGVAVSALMISSFALTAGAWNENPASAETEETTSAETTKVTTTEEPDAEIDDEMEEDPVDTSEEPIETAPPEETAATETAAATTTTAATTVVATTAAAANTVAPDSYNPVEPFEMFVPQVLNVRGGPGTDYDKLGQIYANNVIKIIGTSGDWYVFDYYGADGYLLAELLTEVPETSATTDETPVAEDTPSFEDTVSDDDIAFEDTETAPSETEITTMAPETDETISEDDDDDYVVATPVTEDKNNSSVPPVLLAIICAVAVFLLIGVLPVFVHKAHHKKLYQY